jgi:glycosyltransferase involved in cell wall biosynthesis
MSALDLDVVVVTHQSARHLAHCIEALPQRTRIIVVDNASTDGSAHLATSLGCDVIRSPRNVGFGRAVNLALRERVTSSRVLLLNPDARVEAGTLARLLAEVDEPAVAVAAPRLAHEDGSLQRPWWPFPSARRAWAEALGLHRLRPEDFDRSCDVDFVVGACFLARTEALRAVGGFDERYWLYGEETDLCRRLRDIGWRVRYVADAVAHHVGGASGSDSTDLVAEHFIRGSERFVLTHDGAPALVAFRLANVAGAALRLPFLRPGDARRAVRRRNLRRGARALLRHPTRVAELDASVAQPSLVVCSLEPWDAVWRRNQFFVRELTDLDPSLRVLFVEPPIDPLHEIRAGRRPVLRNARRLRPVTDRPQVIRFQPIKPLPRVLGGWTDASMARQVKRASEQVELVDPVLWVNDLDMTALATNVQWPVVYDITDDWLLASLPRRIARARRRRERALLERADQVVVCSTGLENTKGLFCDVTVITNAVDVEHFCTPRPRPADLPHAPIAMYVGTLHEDRLDVELVAACARDLPNVAFVFVGPNALSDRSVELLTQLRNVHLLGPRPYDDVPAYLQHATVSLVPHVVSSFTESLDPIKAYECLAAGLPTLATPVAGFRDVGDPVRIATSEDFVPALHSLLDESPRRSPSSPLPTWRTQAQRFADVLDAARARSGRERTVRVVYVDHVARPSGGELALVRIMPELVATGVHAHVILGEHGPLERLLRDAGATVEVLPIDPAVRDVRRGATAPGLAGLRSAAKTIGYVRALRRRLRTLGPDVVHTNSLKSNIYGGLAARAAGIPVVWHVRDRIAADYLPASTVRAVRLLARVLPTQLVANSAATRSTVDIDRTVVIHDAYRAAPPDPRIDRGVESIAMVGRISPWKGQHVVIEAFARAFPDGDQRCLVVGSPLFDEHEYETQVHELADRLGVTDRVDFLGHVDDIGSLLAKVDLLVHASIIPEPFGQVIVEGMAAGVPVIATDAGGAREIVTHDVDGILTSPGDVSALAKAMRRVADDSQLRQRLARAGQRRAADFDPAKVVSQYLSVYANVVS